MTGCKLRSGFGLQRWQSSKSKLQKYVKYLQYNKNACIWRKMKEVRLQQVIHREAATLHNCWEAVPLWGARPGDSNRLGRLGADCHHFLAIFLGSKILAYP